MLRAAAGADAPEAFDLLLPSAAFSLSPPSAAFPAGLLELFGGVEGFEDDRRRWWAGLKGSCAVLIAARPKELAGTTVMALVERKALPSAGENMASGGGALVLVLMLVVVLVVDWLAAAQSAARRHALPLKRIDPRPPARTQPGHKP